MLYTYTRVHIRETWHDFAGKFARASVFPVGAETYFRKWRSACRFKGQWGPLLAFVLARSAGNRSICEVPPETARFELCPVVFLIPFVSYLANLSK